MEPFKEDFALLGFMFVTVSPKGREQGAFAGNGRAIDLAQGLLGFAPTPLFRECIEEIIVCARAEDVRILFGQTASDWISSLGWPLRVLKNSA